MLVLQYFFVILAILAYLTLLYNLGTLIAATMLRVKVEEITIGFGKRLFGFQFAHVQFNLGLWIIGGSCRLADYSEYPGLKPLPDEFRSASFRSRLLILSAGSTIILLLSIALLGLSEFFYSLKSTLSYLAAYLFFIDSTLPPIQPFTWQRWVGYICPSYVLSNLLPISGFTGDRLIQTVLNHYWRDDHFVRRLYRILPIVLSVILFVIILIHVIIDLFY